MKITLLFGLLLSASVSYSYPAFISYGYKSCVTCHFNSQGNGPLNDYGRALFAAEIASRSMYDPKTTPEELAESSGFIGKKPLPNWLRPGFKFRALWFQSNPGSTGAKSRGFPMQADMNTALLFDENQKWVAVGSIGYMPTPKTLSPDMDPADKPTNYYSREHYLRWNPQRSIFVFAGLMDKVYGIRTADHTAFSRAKTGLAQNDQAHGMVVQYNAKSWELTLNPFVGHLSQKADLRQKGASLMLEKDLIEKYRIGGTVLSSQNDYVQWNRAEFHSKFGFGTGNSFLAELGVIQDKPKSGDSETGSYVFIESIAQLTRGYNFFSQIEHYNQTMSTRSPDQIRWTFGMLMFPAPKYELRTNLVNGRTQSDSGVSADQWQIQVQLHMAL